MVTTKELTEKLCNLYPERVTEFIDNKFIERVDDTERLYLKLGWEDEVRSWIEEASEQIDEIVYSSEEELLDEASQIVRQVMLENLI